MNNLEIEFRKAFEYSYLKAYRIAKSICFDTHNAEDAVSEAFVRLLRAFKKGRLYEYNEGYFLKIVVNEAKRIISKQRDIPKENIYEYAEKVTMENEESNLYLEQAAQLLFAINTLSDSLSLPIKLHYYGGYSEVETAKLLGISYSAVKTRISRGRAKLKQLLKKNVLGGDYNEV